MTIGALDHTGQVRVHVQRGSLNVLESTTLSDGNGVQMRTLSEEGGLKDAWNP